VADSDNQHSGDNTTAAWRSPPCKDSFIRKHGVNYEEIDQEGMKVVSCPKRNGEHDASMSFHDVATRPLERWCRDQAQDGDILGQEDLQTH
jgi:hypothetical protein